MPKKRKTVCPSLSIPAPKVTKRTKNHRTAQSPFEAARDGKGFEVESRLETILADRWSQGLHEYHMNNHMNWSGYEETTWEPTRGAKFGALSTACFPCRMLSRALKPQARARSRGFRCRAARHLQHRTPIACHHHSHHQC